MILSKRLYLFCPGSAIIIAVGRYNDHTGMAVKQPLLNKMKKINCMHRNEGCNLHKAVQR